VSHNQLMCDVMLCDDVMCSGEVGHVTQPADV